jgi:cation transport protein ChaC
MRKMQLTPELVGRVPPFDGQTGKLAGRSDIPSEADYDPVVDMLLAGANDPRDVWMFAYGSLIFNPEFDHVEERTGTTYGYHRSFCIGWVRIYRGTPERPGIMLGLDRGGACQGVVFRLPADAVRENVMKVVRREMPIKWTQIAARWMPVHTEQGPVRAIGWPVNHANPAYLPDVTHDQVVHALATAAGERGSMAAYLHDTIVQLENRGIHDGYLWKMQAEVARRIVEVWPQG